MKIQLSGWVRLWIVFALATWGIALTLILTSEGDWATPPIFLGRDRICLEYYPPQTNGPGYDRCLRDDAAFVEPRAWRGRNTLAIWGEYWLWWIAPFAVGLMALGGRWVWRGFVPPRSN